MLSIFLRPMAILGLTVALWLGLAPQTSVSVASTPTPQLVMEEYFLGRTVAFGRFQAINGIDRRFSVRLNGTWDGKTLKLVEDFFFENGERDRKTWFFEKRSPSLYIGTRSDVIGEVEVRINGDTALFNYDVYLDEPNQKDLVHFRDRMTLLPSGIVENTASVRKFGLQVGSVQVNFSRSANDPALRRP